MKNHCPICKVITLVAGIGALNWLLVALFKFNLVAALLGDMTPAAKGVYTLVGIAGAILLISVIKACPCCKTSK